LIEPPSPTLTLATTGRAAPSGDDYEAAVIANIHIQAVGMQNINSLISVMLNLLHGLHLVAQQRPAHLQAFLSL
jgi:hypothetical protein